MTYSTKNNNTIIQAQPHQLAVRHVWLVERGIHSLPILGITELRIQELCLALFDFDFDIRARTLETIVDLGPHIRSCRRYLDSLIFPVVQNIYQYFGPETKLGYTKQLELFCHGHHYPPGAEYLELLRTTLQSLLVGPVTSPDEAILDVLYYGTTASQLLAIEWLADNSTAATHESFSDYLRMSLLSTTQKAPLLLALKYADANINDHVDQGVYFFIEEIIMEEMQADLKATARKYLLGLSSQASQETLFYAFDTLTELSDPNNVECTSKLFDEIMLRDLEEYSDDDLETICYYMGWPSDEQDEVDKYEELVMEEIQRREVCR